MPISYVNSNSAVGKSVQLTGVTAGHLIVCMLQWADAATTPTLSDGSSSFSYATVKVSSSERIIIAYCLSSVASGTVTYTWTSVGGGGYTSHVFEVSSGSGFALDTIDAIGSGSTGYIATSGNETSIEASMVAFGAAGYYVNLLYVSGTIGGVAVDHATSQIENSYGDLGVLTMRVLNNPGTYNSVINGESGYSTVWVADLIAFREIASGGGFLNRNYFWGNF